MTVSRAKDSCFRVVANFGNMQVKDGYRTQTLDTLFVGLASILNVVLLSLIV